MRWWLHRETGGWAVSPKLFSPIVCRGKGEVRASLIVKGLGSYSLRGRRIPMG